VKDRSAHCRRVAGWLWGLLALIIVSSCAPATPGPAMYGPTLAQQPYTVAQATRTPTPAPVNLPAPPAVPVPAPNQASRGPVTLVILHTNDARGYVDPCG